MNFLPPGTTWLDIVTLVIAVGGLVLAVWRYRRESRVGVRVEIGLVPGQDAVAVIMTNTERRTVTADRAGITTKKSADGKLFERWHSVNVRRSESGLPLGDVALPKTLDPGGKPYGVVGSLRSIKSAFHPEVPSWAFCVDTYRNVYWGEIPEDVRAAIRETKRRITGPDDDYGSPTAIEIPDDAEVERSALYD